MSRPEEERAAVEVARKALRATKSFGLEMRSICRGSDMDTVMMAMEILSLSDDGSDFERNEAISALLVFLDEADFGE